MENKVINKRMAVGLILAAIILGGIFLRTYHFHDWLRFNADQSRDAAIVSDVLQGETPLPLLGPKAGGTEFKLGPVFYYFEIGAAKIFGSSPDKLAYPDLFFSILSIPLIFFLLKKYFSSNLSLALTALYSLSFYAVRYSRFAWNPNSIPFWMLLMFYSVLEIAGNNNWGKKKILWSLTGGLALGVAVQLHTLLLVTLPAFFLVIFGYILAKNIPLKRYFGIILAIALIVNIPQILNEFQTKGSNIKAFFKGTETKKVVGTKSSVAANSLVVASACSIQASGYIVSGNVDSDECTLLKTGQRIKKYSQDPTKIKYIFLLAAETLFSLIFFSGGIALLIRALRSETDLSRKNLLVLIALYTSLFFLVLVAVSREISMRFYLPITFVPFIFLGLWLDFFKRNLKARKIRSGAIVFGILLVTNLLVIYKEFSVLAQNRTPKGNLDYVTLGEVEGIAHFIGDNSAETKYAVIDGRGPYISKFIKPIQYITAEQGLKVEVNNQKVSQQNPRNKIFYIMHRQESNDSIARTLGNSQLIGKQQVGRFLVVESEKQ